MSLGAFIVDDQADVRLLIRMLIEGANDGLFVTGEASGGHHALGQLDDADPDVIILDQMMPGLSGVDTAGLIASRRPGQRIILLTAYLDEELRGQAEEAGIQVCLAKDRTGDLVQTLRAMGSGGAR